MMLDLAHGAEVIGWMNERLGVAFAPPAAALGVRRAGRIVGGVVVNNYNRINCDVSVAGEPRAWSPAFMRALAVWIWRELGAARVTMLTENPVVERLAVRMGAQREGTLRNWFGPGRDAAVFGLLREDWRLTRW